jgi:hypothetical protein
MIKTFGKFASPVQSRDYVCRKTLPKRNPKTTAFGQTVDAQREHLCAAGCKSRNIYREKGIGARAGRRELLRMLDRLASVGFAG